MRTKLLTLLLLPFLLAAAPPSKLKNIFQAAEKGTVDDVRHFLEQGVDVNARNSVTRIPPDGQGMSFESLTPLQIAVSHNSDVEVPKFLIENGADIHAKTVSVNTIYFEDTPLHLAAKRKDGMLFVKLLIESGADVNARNSYDHTPLLSASYSHYEYDVMEYLIAQGADVHAKDKNGYTTLHMMARYHSNLDIVKLLVTPETNLDGPLLWAAAGRSVDVLKYLIAQGANVHVKTADSQTTLHLAAAKYVDVDILKTLIELGVDVNAKRSDGRTPLDLAETKEKITILREAGGLPTFRGISRSVQKIRDYLAEGGNVNAKDDDGWTLLHFVVRYRHAFFEPLKFLLAQGADVHAKTEKGETPLHLAAAHNSSVELLDILFENGADIHAKTDDGQTPLHYAANKNRDIRILKTLIDQGADIHAKDKDGKTSLDYADTEEKQAILREAAQSEPET